MAPLHRSDRTHQEMNLLGSLELTLLNLRKKWPRGWPGLSLVFERCLQQLGYSLGPSGMRLQSVANCAAEVAQWLEQEGRRMHRRRCEPQYHNRLHMADTLVCMTLLLKAQRHMQATSSSTTRRHEWLALLAMLAHDLLHDGSVNQYPAQLESRSVQALEPVMQRHGMLREDQLVVRHLILKTDPQCVRESHALVADRDFVVEDVDCLAVLVQEADILASTLTVTGLNLTQRLSAEWATSNPSMSRILLTHHGRLRFLEFGALFSSPASQWMGIQEARQAEMNSLRRELEARTDTALESVR